MTLLFWLAACHGGDSDTSVDFEALDAYTQVPCAVAGAEGVAVRAQVGALARYGDAFPVVSLADSLNHRLHSSMPSASGTVGFQSA